MKETEGTHVALAASRLISSKGSAGRVLEPKGAVAARAKSLYSYWNAYTVETYIQSYLCVYVCFVLRISVFIKNERYRYKQINVKIRR